MDLKGEPQNNKPAPWVPLFHWASGLQPIQYGISVRVLAQPAHQRIERLTLPQRWEALDCILIYDKNRTAGFKE